MRRGLPAGIAVLLAAAACTRGDAPPAHVPDSAVVAEVDTPAVEGPTAVSACTNERDGYALEYPRSWHVAVDSTARPCSYFDPEPVRIPYGSELPLEIAIRIGVDPVDFATASAGMLGQRELSRQQTTVAGRPAVRIEAETTGEGLHDRGIRLYQYLVDLEGRTLIATTYDAGPTAFPQKHAVLDAMMQSLRLPGGD